MEDMTWGKPQARGLPTPSRCPSYRRQRRADARDKAMRRDRQASSASSPSLPVLTDVRALIRGRHPAFDSALCCMASPRPSWIRGIGARPQRQGGIHPDIVREVARSSTTRRS